MLRDAYGLPVSTTSRAAVDAYDRGVSALLGFAAAPADSFVEALRHDAEFSLARAALGVSRVLEERMAEARQAMEAATTAAARLPSRERRHVEALALWVGGRVHEAIALMKETLAEQPRDVVLLQRLYFIYFWQGRSAEMLELTAAAWPSFALDSYLVGLHAFSLEENHRFDEALALAERAVAVNPKDAWAVHALAHVHYARGDHARGLEALPPRIAPCDHLGYFRNHLLWHLALMHLAGGGYESVRRMFASVFGRAPIAVASDFHDAVSLAWRLDLYGRPDPARWTALATAARNRFDQSSLLFHDLHVGMALAAAGEWQAALHQLEGLRERSRDTRNRTVPEVVMPLLEGLHAFAAGDYATAAQRIEGIQERIVEVGGSHAQREVFHHTLIAAALRADLEDRGTALLHRSLGKRSRFGHDAAAVAVEASARR